MRESRDGGERYRLVKRIFFLLDFKFIFFFLK